jgi:hypothetical protein
VVADLDSIHGRLLRVFVLRRIKGPRGRFGQEVPGARARDVAPLMLLANRVGQGLELPVLPNLNNCLCGGVFGKLIW